MKGYITAFIAVFVSMIMISTSSAMPKNISKNESTIDRILNKDTSLDAIDGFLEKFEKLSNDDSKSTGVAYDACLLLIIRIIFIIILIPILFILDLPPPRFPYL